MIENTGADPIEIITSVNYKLIVRFQLALQLEPNGVSRNCWYQFLAAISLGKYLLQRLIGFSIESCGKSTRGVPKT